jgi:serine protease Do
LIATLTALVLVSALAGALLNERRHRSPGQELIAIETSASAQSKQSGEPSFLRQSSESFRAVARAVNPAVVIIKTTIGGGGGHGARHGRPPQGGGNPFGGGGGPFGGDPFYDFFRQFQQPQQQPKTQQALGSGFIIDKRGYIVTNNHVVDGATKVVVNLPSAEELDVPAKVIGTDPRSDLAVIKIDHPGDLPVVEWADSDSVEVGDWAVAIGSPFMLSHTVTVGIVSAKGRSASAVVGSDYGYDMLQTDAAINPGNSGGPLCTIDGKVMGVNTAIFTESGGYMGIGFAIPSNVARNITATLSKGGKVIRGFLGVVIQPLDEGMAKDLGLTGGALVHEVQPASPAAKAGIRPGDVVVEFNGKPVKDPTFLQHQVSELKPGDKAHLKLISYNDRKTRTVDVTIGQLPDKGPAHGQSEAQQEEGEPDALGLAVSQVHGGKGIQVDDVAPNSLGDMAGFQPGDIIVSINRTPMKSVSQYRKEIAAGKRLNILVQRGDQQLFFQLDLSQQ